MIHIRRITWFGAGIALLVLTAAALLLTISDYGCTHDEGLQRRYGQYVIRWYTSGFAAQEALHFKNLYYYGGLFDAAAEAAAAVLPMPHFDARHVVNALAGVAGVAGAWALARRIAGDRAAFFAALLLVLTPFWYGQMPNNPKDVPFASCYVWAVLGLTRWIEELPRPSWTARIAAAVPLGLAVGIRVGGFFLVAVAAAAVVVSPLVNRAAPLRPAAAWTRGAAETLVLAVAATAVCLPFWPWAAVDPLSHIPEAVRVMSAFPVDIDTAHHGRLVSSHELPRWFGPEMLAVTLPEALLLLLASAAVRGALALRRRGAFASAASRGLLWTAAASAGALLYVVVRHVTLYGCARHLLFVVPLLAVLGGVELECLLRNTSGPRRLAIACAACVAAVLQLGVLVALHPQQVSWFNGVTGWMSGASGRYPLDVYGNVYREAVGQLDSFLAARAVEGPVPVWATNMTCARTYLTPRMQWSGGPESAQYVIVADSGLALERDWGERVAAVERFGVPIAVTFARRPGTAK